MGRVLKCLSTLCAVGVSACGEGAVPAPEAIVSDSAGVRIVTNPSEAPVLSWVVGTTPLLTIGGSAAAEQEQLFRVRDATRLSDGRVVVANAGSHELRFYGSDGAFLGASGREGEGPGEFQGIWVMHRSAGDSLLVHDLQNQRTSLFDPQGTFVRTIERELSDDVRFSGVIDYYDDGSQLAQSFVDTGEQPPEGLQRFSSDLYHFGVDGTLLAQLGPYSTDETYFVPVPGGGFSFWEPLFGRRSHRVAAGDRFVFADDQTFDVQVRDPDGSLRMRIRRAEPAPAVQQHHVEASKELRLEDMTDDDARREFEGIWSRIEVPDRFPAHGRILGDALGFLWVEVYRQPSDEIMRWEVFDPGGVLIGQVTFPEVLDPVFEIGADYVLGRTRDAFDVEGVRMYGLIRE